MSCHFKVTTHSEDETKQLGTALGNCLQPGIVISLNGNLGAGKTRFVQGVATALGVNEKEVTSPTFTLIQEYAGTIPLYHFDTYRLRDSDEFAELGAPEILDLPAISLLEWGDRMAEYLPESTLRIKIDIVSETDREFNFSASKMEICELLELLKQRLG
ncbi:tRNA threonylcarbamoyladenosine biosynthesis protein TsaE [Polystyrenella longa]|uniref:tRNA threonylcarbamoyladenosine biosynthesis protein TsaE n=1 Tax=Polystyrenella longa TaxID=2528007 RepID=A0A518CP86_9PLAN|nr:tRNA (adenosine(37)-N6)-threonylcarbamoyltransferase complex ATPase subunit type 1 TsaE [Polystyrenella longa]QDU81014.1 tRNA threonylcarbamoyladenosine biosynthesis protein TsaE [Polystyrenella longa]